MQINAQGEAVSHEEQVYMCLKWSVGLGNISKINLPLGTSTLSRATELLNIIMKHNFIPSILIIAGAVIIPPLYYSPQVAPSSLPVDHLKLESPTAIKDVLSIFGMCNCVLLFV